MVFSMNTKTLTIGIVGVFLFFSFVEANLFYYSFEKNVSIYAN